MHSAVAATAVALALLVATPASAADRRVVKTCSSQSFADFPHAYRDDANLVVGPLAWLFANRADGDGSYMDRYRWKQPVLVRPGRTVTLRLGAAVRDFARLSYNLDGWSFTSGARTVVFKGCSRTRAGSKTDGKRVTFFSGGIVTTRASACVPVEIRIDRGAVRRRVLAVGGATCSAGLPTGDELT